MTEENTPTTPTEEQATCCVMGRKMPKPCPFPASVSLPHHLEGDGPHLCAFHSATEPLIAEVDELSLSLDLCRAYLKGARRHSACGSMVTVLERAEADFSERLELIHKAMKDLKAAEYALIR